MGCKLVRGETIYFVRHGGPTASDIEAEWYGDEADTHLLPCVYTRSDGRFPPQVCPAVPIEILTFKA